MDISKVKSILHPQVFNLYSEKYLNNNEVNISTKQAVFLALVSMENESVETKMTALTSFETSFYEVNRENTTFVVCPVCKEKKAEIFEQLHKRADEGTTTFYKCIACKSTGVYKFKS